MLRDEEEEELEGLPLHLEAAAFATELKFAAIKAEVAKLIHGRWHGSLPEVAEV